VCRFVNDRGAGKLGARVAASARFDRGTVAAAHRVGTAEKDVSCDRGYDTETHRSINPFTYRAVSVPLLVNCLLDPRHYTCPGPAPQWSDAGTAGEETAAGAARSWILAGPAQRSSRPVGDVRAAVLATAVCGWRPSIARRGSGTRPPDVMEPVLEREWHDADLATFECRFHACPGRRTIGATEPATRRDPAAPRRVGAPQKQAGALVGSAMDCTDGPPRLRRRSIRYGLQRLANDQWGSAVCRWKSGHRADAGGAGVRPWGGGWHVTRSWERMVAWFD
jgi:hypothetical protein